MKGSAGAAATAATAVGPADPGRAVAVRIAHRDGIGARVRNEDRLAVLQCAQHWCLVLSDGAGGHAGGELAAQLVIERVVAGFRSRPATDGHDLAELLLDAHDAVTAAQRRRPTAGAQGMHATVVVLAIDASRGLALWGHVGDSRLYRWRAGLLDTVTRDDSALQSLLDAAAAPAAPGPERPARGSVLLAALGAAEEARPHVSAPVPIDAADAFLLCSDGWWAALEPQAISTTLAEASSPDAWLEAMIALIERRADPRQDNYSAIACWILPGGQGQP